MFRMAPPKKTVQQKLSLNAYKNNKVSDPDEEVSTMYISGHKLSWTNSTIIPSSHFDCDSH